MLLGSGWAARRSSGPGEGRAAPAARGAARGAAGRCSIRVTGPTTSVRRRPVLRLPRQGRGAETQSSSPAAGRRAARAPSHHTVVDLGLRGLSQPDGGRGGDDALSPTSSAGPSCSEDRHGLQVHRSGRAPWVSRRRSACGERGQNGPLQNRLSAPQAPRRQPGLGTIPPTRGSQVTADRPSPNGPRGCVRAWGSGWARTSTRSRSRGRPR